MTLEATLVEARTALLLATLAMATLPLLLFRLRLVAAVLVGRGSTRADRLVTLATQGALKIKHRSETYYKPWILFTSLIIHYSVLRYRQPSTFDFKRLLA